MESNHGLILKGKAEELGEKPILMPFCPPKIPYGQTESESGVSLERPAFNYLSHVTDWRFSIEVQENIFSVHGVA
jgi:hypothetical protein